VLGLGFGGLVVAQLQAVFHKPAKVRPVEPSQRRQAPCNDDLVRDEPLLGVQKRPVTTAESLCRSRSNCRDDATPFLGRLLDVLLRICSANSILYRRLSCEWPEQIAIFIQPSNGQPRRATTLVRPGLSAPHSSGIVVGLRTRFEIGKGIVLWLTCRHFHLNLVNPDWEV
jgi:hypothetical protein